MAPPFVILVSGLIRHSGFGILVSTFFFASSFALFALFAPSRSLPVFARKSVGRGRTRFDFPTDFTYNFLLRRRG
jgi:hypothetical protein